MVDYLSRENDLPLFLQNTESEKQSKDILLDFDKVPFTKRHVGGDVAEHDVTA